MALKKTTTRYVHIICTLHIILQFSILQGVASPPGRPVIELSTRLTAPEEDSVTDEINLSWASPEDDGGYPITGKHFTHCDQIRLEFNEYF